MIKWKSSATLLIKWSVRLNKFLLYATLVPLDRGKVVLQVQSTGASSVQLVYNYLE